MLPKTYSIKSQLNTFYPVDFGALHEFAAADDWYITREVAGEVFIWTINWISRGSTIQFDDNTPIPLIPLQPYFINFRKITIHLYSPIVRGWSMFYTIVSSDRISGMIFTNKQNYFNCSNFNQRFLVTVLTPANHLVFKIRGYYGDYCRILANSMDVVTASWYIYGDVAEGALTDVRPAICWNTTEQKAINTRVINNSQVIQNTWGGLQIQKIYSNNSFDIYFNLEFCTGQVNSHNINILSDYKSELTANKGFSYFYDVPESGKDLHYHIQDPGATAFQSITLYAIHALGTLTRLTGNSGIYYLSGRYENIGGFKQVCLSVVVNAAFTQNINIVLGTRNE